MGPKSSSSMGPLELVVDIWGDEPQIHRLPMHGEVRIGRQPHVNDIVIPHGSVSRRHAVLRLGSSLRIEDRRSRNGTIVLRAPRETSGDTTVMNGRYIGQNVEIEVGDRISIGSVMMMVRPATTTSMATHGLHEWDHGPTIVDPLMKALYQEVLEVASSRSNTPVLILGETGAGKEELAETIYRASPRSHKKFEKFNCVALAPSLIESQLFGHVKGAFTGSIADKKGIFEHAHGGTLFLDEIGELPLDLQPKLLRALEGEICRVGDPSARRVDVRIIAATNRNMEALVRQGLFRQDLYFRLRGFEYEIPPLRKRRGDIIPLAERFLTEECRKNHHPKVARLSPEAREYLLRYDFPGNVRELKLAMSTAAVRCRGEEILREHLPRQISGFDQPPPESEITPEMPTPQELSEKDRITRALEESAGNQTQAAKALGMPLRTFVSKLDRYLIPRPRKRNPPQGTRMSDSGNT